MGLCAGGPSGSMGWEGCLRECPKSAGSTVTLHGELLQLGHWRSHPLGQGMLGLWPGSRLNWGGVGTWQ